MKKSALGIFAFLLTFILFFSNISANENEVDKILSNPVPTYGFVDYTGDLDEAKLKKKLVEYNNTLKGTELQTQIGVVAINELGSYSIEEAALKIARHWKIGLNETKSGILYIYSKNNRKNRLEISNNAGTILTDGRAKTLLNGLKGDYRAGRYSDGTLVLLDNIFTIFNEGKPEKANGGIAVVSGKMRSSYNGMQWFMMTIALLVYAVPLAALLNVLDQKRSSSTKDKSDPKESESKYNKREKKMVSPDLDDTSDRIRDILLFNILAGANKRSDETKYESTSRSSYSSYDSSSDDFFGGFDSWSGGGFDGGGSSGDW